MLHFNRPKVICVESLDLDHQKRIVDCLVSLTPSNRVISCFGDFSLVGAEKCLILSNLIQKPGDEELIENWLRQLLIVPDEWFGVYVQSSRTHHADWWVGERTYAVGINGKQIISRRFCSVLLAKLERLTLTHRIPPFTINRKRKSNRKVPVEFKDHVTPSLLSSTVS